MRYDIKGDPFPVVICTLDSGEAVNCQKGAMAWMSPNMQMSTNAGGGVGRMFSRAFSGESIFQNIYTAQNGPGEIAFAASVPGKILSFDISPNRNIVAQKHSRKGSVRDYLEEKVLLCRNSAVRVRRFLSLTEVS